MIFESPEDFLEQERDELRRFAKTRSKQYWEDAYAHFEYKLFVNWDSLDHGLKLHGWSRTVIRNNVNDEYRNRRKEVLAEDPYKGVQGGESDPTGSSVTGPSQDSQQSGVKLTEDPLEALGLSKSVDTTAFEMGVSDALLDVLRMWWRGLSPEQISDSLAIDEGMQESAARIFVAILKIYRRHPLECVLRELLTARMDRNVSAEDLDKIADNLQAPKRKGTKAILKTLTKFVRDPCSNEETAARYVEEWIHEEGFLAKVQRRREWPPESLARLVALRVTGPLWNPLRDYETIAPVFEQTVDATQRRFERMKQVRQSDEHCPHPWILPLLGEAEDEV